MVQKQASRHLNAFVMVAEFLDYAPERFQLHPGKSLTEINKERMEKKEAVQRSSMHSLL